MAGAPERILVTGASGFVGSHLVAALATALPGASVATDPFDITDPVAVQQAIRRVQPDACVHLAAVTFVPAANADPSIAWRVNLQGTLNVAQALLAERPGCTLLFASSAEVYGRSFARGTPLDETAVPSPRNTYGATKAAADLALGAMAEAGLRIVRARPFNHTGPGQSADFAVPAWAQQIARIAAGRQKPVMQVGALDPLRDFLDVRDVCACYVRCLVEAERIESGTILNIASGVSRRVGEVLQEMLDLAAVEVQVVSDTARFRPTETPVVAGDAGLARRLLGWAPVIPWRQTLTDTLADWRERVRAEPA